MTPDNVSSMILYAWVGEDELGSGEVGIKQALVPVGYVPLVACKEGKIDRDMVKEQLQTQANLYGKTIRLCRFEFVEEIERITPK